MITYAIECQLSIALDVSKLVRTSCQVVHCPTCLCNASEKCLAGALYDYMDYKQCINAFARTHVVQQRSQREIFEYCVSDSLLSL